MEIFSPVMVMDHLELCCLLDMTRTCLMIHILHKTFRISTLTNCLARQLDRMPGKGGANNGNSNSSKITSEPSNLLF